MKIPYSILFIATIILLTSCEKPKKKIILQDVNTKHDKELYTEYNPIFLSKECNEATAFRVFVPKPYPYRVANTLNTTHSLVFYIDSLEKDTILINDEFFILKDSTKFNIGYKIIELEMPPFSDSINESGNITLELFSNAELITTYKTRYQYISDETIKSVIKRDAVGTMQYAGPLKLANYKNDFKIKEKGYYTDDIKTSHKITKMKDHYLSTYVADGTKITFSEDNKTNWKKIMNVPKFPILTSKIPLEFELKEKNYEGQTIGSYVVDNESLGENIVFTYYNNIIGNTITFHYDKCKFNIIESRKVSMPQHIKFNTTKDSEQAK